MTTALLIAQIILAIFITAAVLLQAKGTGLGTTWGGGGETYHSRRGFEKVLFYATIVATALFTAVSLAVVSV
jgi:protein translocase SecG subunit